MGEELSLKESFSDTGYFLKWFAVLLVMGSSNIILHRKYGNMKDDFFKNNKPLLIYGLPGCGKSTLSSDI